MKRSISIGDAVVLPGNSRAEVMLIGKSNAWYLVRVKTIPAPKEPTYVMCTPGEVQRINAWWNEPSTGKRYASGTLHSRHAYRARSARQRVRGAA